ncbi:MAG: hypothetical protein M9894_19070 [Planctomycetes bacterium]|nr:hypothetical protein [Planctomycetota bacterium]
MRREVERRAAGEALVEDRPEAVDVGARVERLVVAHGLLGRHVAGGAQRGAGGGQALVAPGLGDAEVRDPRHAVRVEEDVRRLEVAVEDPAPVRVLEPVRRLRQHLEGAALVHGPGAPQERVQRLAADQLHGQVADAVGLADVVDRDDVAVREARRGAGLVEEALHVLARGVDAREERLQGHRALQALVHGLVDGPHAALGDQRRDAVGPHAPPDEPRGRQRLARVLARRLQEPPVVRSRGREPRVGVPGARMLGPGARPAVGAGPQVARAGDVDARVEVARAVVLRRPRVTVVLRGAGVRRRRRRRSWRRPGEARVEARVVRGGRHGAMIGRGAVVVQGAPAAAV